MKILGPRLINNDKYLLYIEDTAMDPSRRNKRKHSPISQNLEQHQQPPALVASSSNDEDGVAMRRRNTNTVNEIDTSITSAAAAAFDSSSEDPAVGASPSSSSRRLGKRRRKEKVVEKDLGKDYEPNPTDCICGRGKEAASHPGNVHFRNQIDFHLRAYRESTTKKEKTTIVCDIIDSVRSASPRGKFVRRQSDGRWYETGDDFAREKIGQCFRDRLHTEYRSSSKAKISRRKDTTSTRNPSMPLVDFDEYVASPDHASQNQLHLVTPSAGLQQSNSSGRHLPGWPSGHPTATTEHPPPPSGGDFPVPVVRRKTNFQGLADVYFGDAPSANPPHSASQRSERQQPHEDLLGSLTHNSSRDSTRTYYNAMNAHPSMTHSRSSSMNMMDHTMRGHELDHHQRHHSAAYFEGGSSNFSHGNQHQMMMMRYPTAHANTNSFASLPPNAFAADRSGMFGGVPENIPLQETHMESSQRLYGIPMMATSMGYHRRSGGMEMMAMEAFKGMGGYMQQHAGASWQARSERKPPPMQPTMFEAPPTFAKERVQERVIPEREAPQAEHQVKASPEGLDSSGESSRIPDDEPLPLH